MTPSPVIVFGDERAWVTPRTTAPPSSALFVGSLGGEG